MSELHSPDAIIVGAGNAGLTAARILPDAGKKVLVLEEKALLEPL